MNFLVQKIDGEIKHDFAFEIIQAKEYYDWLGDEEYEITYADDKVPELARPDKYIPIGSVDFVLEFAQKYYPRATKGLLPMNVPEVLFDEARRWIINVEKPWDLNDLDKAYIEKIGRVYRKSLTRIKSEFNGLVEYHGINDVLEFQISEEIPIDSEWRVFVFNEEVLHVSNYSGDPLLFPDKSAILYMIQILNESGTAPKAYTLDVGVHGINTFVIECHRFFSCGLYGFNDHLRIPKMFSQEWNEIKLQ